MKKMTSIFLTILLVLAAAVPAFASTPAEEFSVQQIKTTVPTGVKAASYSCSKIKVTWDPVPGADGYIVYRSESRNGVYSKAYSTSDPEKNWYINTGRTCGRTWYYKVRGYCIRNGKRVYTKYSKPVSAYARPNKVKRTSLSTGGDVLLDFHLKWKPVSGASGYQVYIRQQGMEKYQLAGTYTKTSAVFAIPDTRNLYDVKVRAYRTVKGKKVYGLFSDVVSYSFDWDADMLKEAGEAYLLKTYPGITLDDTLSTGVKKNPWDGFTSWSALWPASYCRYQSWDMVKADLEETIRLDMENYGNALDYMCMWIEPEDAASHEENWVSIWMLN